MIAIVFVLIAALAIWYFMPTTFLSKVNPSDIKSISVFDGNTGERFDFSDAEEASLDYSTMEVQDFSMDDASVGTSSVPMVQASDTDIVQ